MCTSKINSFKREKEKKMIHPPEKEVQNIEEWMWSNHAENNLENH